MTNANFSACRSFGHVCHLNALLRHSFGTELVRGGANIRAVQELMRHSSLQTTQRYTQVLDEDRREALAVLPERVIPDRSGRKAA